MINNKEEVLCLANSAESKALVILTKLRLTRLEVTFELAIIWLVMEPAFMLQREGLQIGYVVRVCEILQIDLGCDPCNAIALEILIYLDSFKEMKIPGEVFLQSIIRVPKRLPKIALLCK